MAMCGQAMKAYSAASCRPPRRHFFQAGAQGRCAPLPACLVLGAGRGSFPRGRPVLFRQRRDGSAARRGQIPGTRVPRGLKPAGNNQENEQTGARRGGCRRAALN